VNLGIGRTIRLGAAWRVARAPLHHADQATIGTWLSASILDFVSGVKAARRLVTAGLAVAA
jgi:hypothetical protein